MRSATAIKPFYVNLPFQHRKVLDLLKQRNGKSLKGLILESIEDLAVKHRLVRESTNIHDWPEWD